MVYSINYFTFIHTISIFIALLFELIYHNLPEV